MVAADLGARILASLTKPLKWWVVVAEWEQGLRVRLGKNTKRLAPGIHFRIPWLDRIYVQSTRLRTMDQTNITCQTLDGKTVVFNLATHFVIDDVKKMYKELASPESTVEALAIEQGIAYIGDRNAVHLTAANIAECMHIEKAEEWGLGQIRFVLTAFSVCRAYRLMLNDYGSGSGINSLDTSGYAGERK